MGRKIPARKHRGVKDPEKQHAIRFASIKNKINNPPKDPDDQAVPRKLLELQQSMQRSNRAKESREKIKKLHKDKDLIDTSKFRQKEFLLPGMRRPEKPVPVFKQKPGEAPHRFLHRIHLKCQEVIHESTFEDKFNVNVKRNVDTGEVEGVSKMPKNEILFMRNLTTDNKTPKKSRSANNRDKRKKKKLEKSKAKLEKNVDEFARYKDQVKFGEVVHEPPQFNILPRKSTKSQDMKPGKRDLLLKGMLEPSTTSIVSHLPKKEGGKKKIKLPTAEKRIQEKLRVEAVEAYRQVKATRHRLEKKSAQLS